MKILCVLAALAIAAGNSYSQGTGGLPARDVSIGYPSGLAVDGKGNLYFVDRDNSQVLRVSPDGLMTLVAGNGSRDSRATESRRLRLLWATPWDAPWEWLWRSEERRVGKECRSRWLPDN